MEKYPKQVKLKNEKVAVLRQLKEDDVEMLVDFFQSLEQEDRMYLRLDVTKKENIVKRYGKIDYDSIFPVIGLEGDRIIAIGTLFRPEFGWARNLGEIRVVIARDLQRQGLCTILVRELFLYALTTDLFKIKVELMERQKSAITAFERMGFRKEAVLKNHVINIEGERRNLVMMSLDIKDMWSEMEDFVQDRFYVT